MIKSPISQTLRPYTSFLVSSLLFCLLACSTSDAPTAGEEGPQPPEESQTQFTRITYRNFFNDEQTGQFLLTFDNGKMIREELLDNSGAASERVEYQYNPQGMVSRIMRVDAMSNLRNDQLFTYDGDRLTQVESRRYSVSAPDTLYQRAAYSPNTIRVEVRNTQNELQYYNEFYLNAAGVIFRQDNGDVEVTIEYLEGLPVSKTIASSFRNEVVDYVYLDTPEAQAPWNRYWRSIYGSNNNRIVSRPLTGIIDLEDTIDLDAYLVDAGEALQITYEFNPDGLPIRVEKTFGPSLRTVWEIEYSE